MYKEDAAGFAKKDLISVKEHWQFLKDSKHFIISFLSTVFERTSVGSVILRCSSIFNHANLFVNELDNSKWKMKKVLNFLVENNMTASKFDCAMSWFCGFVHNDVKKSSAEFHNFGKATDRLDVCFEIDFYCKPLKCICREWVQCKQFDFRKPCESRNRYCSLFHQVLYDCKWIMVSYIWNKQLLNFISKETRGRYQQELEEKKSYKEKNDKEKQSTLLQIKTNIVKMKIRDIQRGCSKRDEEFINSMRQAEKKEWFLWETL